MRVVGYVSINDENSKDRAMLEQDGFEIFGKSPTIVMGCSYLKMFVNEEQELYLRLRYGHRIIDLTAK